MSAPGPILLAAGGTGGHLFPAEALASELLGRGRVVALVTDRRTAAFGDRLAHVAVHRIHAATPSQRNPIARLHALASLALGALESMWLIARLSPAVVIGFGGYPSVPALAAASLLSRRIVLHEQNAVMGRANRLFARRARAIAASFPALGTTEGAIAGKTTMTGNPVRPAIQALADRAYAALEATGEARIVVTGGSQGASIFAAILPDALALLPAALRQRLRLTQQCRAEDLDRVRAQYAELGVTADLAPFFSDIAERLSGAHLAICRAGASTVAELAVAGVPSILVPYPFAADDHQTANARIVEASGAGWLMPQGGFTSEALAARLTALLAEPSQLSAAAANARTLGTRDAARRLADLVDRVGAAS